ncbi:MAG: hypothetical protein ACD_13C00187G0002 [uncultured bacterium]|nr:MAG: hypothetical protein ACD_13C00187G0002 [uncultured bacterium]
MEYPKDLSLRSIAQILENIAAAYEVQGEDQFRIRAYQNAAAGIEHTGEDIRQLWEQKKLDDIPGVGVSIAQHLDELFRTGKVSHFDQVTKKLPEGFFELLKLEGVGPKTAFKLAKAFQLKNAREALAQLKTQAQAGQIQKLPGFAQETEQNILEAIEEREQKTGPERMGLFLAQSYADRMVPYLEANQACLHVEPLGSLRRQAPTVGDIDLAMASSHPQECIDHFIRYPGKQKILAQGGNTARIILKDGIQVDLKVVKPKEFGSLLQHFTGSKQHNIMLRDYALQLSLSLSEYGIKYTRGKKKGKTEHFDKEEDFYRFLGLDWIPPELREGTEEIEAAKDGHLPDLVELEDIKGDLHVHSDIAIATSHDGGESSLEELAQVAQELGYEYLGVSDHNPKQAGISTKKVLSLLKARKDKIDQFNSSHERHVKNRGQDVFLFHSLEVDIKPDGSLALPEPAFEMFDFLIASVHSSFSQDKRRMTQRVLRALAHPKVKILGHQTGRMFGSRPGYELDWDQIFAFCKEKDIFLEINAWPKRLDLPEHLVKEAISRGVRLVIDTDSHSAQHLKLMHFGVSVARRGWAQKPDIVNALPLAKIKGIMKEEKRKT